MNARDIAYQTKSLQQPDHDDDEHHYVKQALYAGRHRYVGVDQPHNQADHDQNNHDTH